MAATRHQPVTSEAVSVTPGDTSLAPGEPRVLPHHGRVPGECFYCGESCGASSTICVACGFNPKRRERRRAEREL